MREDILLVVASIGMNVAVLYLFDLHLFLFHAPLLALVIIGLPLLLFVLLAVGLQRLVPRSSDPAQ